MAGVWAWVTRTALGGGWRAPAGCCTSLRPSCCCAARMSPTGLQSGLFRRIYLGACTAGSRSMTHTQNMPTPWWGVRDAGTMLPHDAMHICFSLEHEVRRDYLGKPWFLK